MTCHISADGLKWLLQRLAAIFKWLAKNTFWWTEYDPAEDALMRAAISLPTTDSRARVALCSLSGSNVPADLNDDYVFNQALLVSPAPPTENSQRDEWVLLMERLDAVRKAEESVERRDDIRALMDLMFAFNRDEETALHHALSKNATDPLTTRYIESSYNYCERQMRRFQTGVAWFPIGQSGEKLYFLEAIAFYLSVTGIFIINCFTEFITYSFKEYVGVARNGVGRPRSLYQILIALFSRKSFNLADGPFAWEIGRQRTLGASLSFVSFAVAFFHPSLYRQKSFIAGVAVGATLFQVTIQLGDIAWFRIKRLRVAKEARPEMAWSTFIHRWFRGGLPLGAQHDFDMYGELAKCNLRSAAWAKTYTKSRAMSLLWIEFARNRAAAGHYYAARAGIFPTTVYSLAFLLKLLFPLLTLGSLALSAYALWGQWQVFIIVIAFHTIAYLKGLDLAFAQEQEVTSAGSVWCNMIGANVPTIFIVLLPRAANSAYLTDPKDLGIIMPVTFFISQWTDLIASGLTHGMKLMFAGRA